MANEEHLKVLRQGVKAWNEWRVSNGSNLPDLSGADFHGAFLGKADLSHANLTEANLTNANLYRADLSRANLSGAYLSRTRLSRAQLCEADMTRARLNGTDLSNANLSSSDLTEAVFGGTIINNLDLSGPIGLATCSHTAPSSVDYRTLQQSSGVPLNFWRGCGLPDILIDYIPSLAGDAIEFYSCFISYSSKDQAFADRLHADLQNNGVRCWFAPQDMRTGDRIRDTIDEQIRVHEKLFLILSDNSVSSNWVENEVEAALDKEMDRQTVLFPIRIDAAIEETDVAWAKTIKRTRHITDFSGWKDHDSYQRAFQRILRDLKPQ